MKLHVGTSGYAYKEWKGTFYPERIPSKDMLRFYSERLSAVEINNTFYRMPSQRVLSSWAAQVPEGFVFALKAPQAITHVRRLRDVGEQTDYLFKSLSALGSKLGPVLFQFPKSFRMHRPLLEDFLALIPGDVCCAFAFRSSSWLDDAILSLLRERECSLCIEDADDSPAEATINTVLWGYLRLRRSDYTDAGLSQWARKALSQDWEKAFVFFKHEDEATAPQNAVRFREIFDSVEPAG